VDVRKTWFQVTNSDKVYAEKCLKASSAGYDYASLLFLIGIESLQVPMGSKSFDI
jgi:hypothetical protein